MKKFLSIILCSFLLTSPVLAKSGSGGQPASDTDPVVNTPAPEPEPVVIPDPEPEPVGVPSPTPVSAPPVVSDPLPKSTSAPASNPPVAVPAQTTTNDEPETSAPPTTPVKTLQKTSTTTNTVPSTPAELEKEEVEPELTYSDCAAKGRSNVRSGVTCFMALPSFYSQDTFRSFTEDYKTTGKVSDDYQPLGCAYTAQNDTCRDIYWKLYEAKTYDENFGKPVISSAKKVLGLPEQLLPASKACEDQADGCRDEYKKKVTWLVGARLYLAQQQARKWYEAGLLPKGTFKEFLIFIVESKHRFYPSPSASEQKAILQETIIQWKKLAQVAKENQLNPLDNNY